MSVVDAVAAITPRPVPTRSALQCCRIISHRGEHDNVRVMENTLAAFEQARTAGVWGIECDIRWTADLVPVICHDPNPGRVFGYSQALQDLSFAQLRDSVPDIPTLQEVIDQFGGNTHLMLEIKAEPWPQPEQQCARLRQLLQPLSAVDDYHFLALDPALFQVLDFVPPQGLLPVAELNAGKLSRAALAKNYAGLGGHYLLLHSRLKRRHDAAGQKLGVGFPASKNALFRELNRGIEWIFSNDAVKLQGILDQHLNKNTLPKR